MKSYLLLRDNQESGPYTLDEFKRNGLLPNDLIWIEGQSTCWSFPSEIDELKAFVRKQEKPVKKQQQNTKPVPVHVRQSSNKEQSTPATDPAVDYSQYLYGFDDQETKELFADFKLQSSKKRFSLGANLVALLVLAIGVAMTAYVVRGIVLSFDNDSLQSAQAMKIQSVSYESEHAAYGGTAVQNAVYREVLPPPVEPLAEPKTAQEEIVMNKPEKTVEEKTEPAEKKPVEVKPEPEPVKEEASENTTEKANDEPVEKKTAEPKKKDVRSQVSVAANDYKVGLLGGISDLELSVKNSSSSTINKAVVEVSYYKKNGSVINKETVQVQNIKPGSSKKVQVPASSRGVKVDYRIVNVDAGETDS